jgi:hypothetical protein
MTEIFWLVNRKFLDSTGNSIHVLQRFLPDINEAKDDELVPFFHEISLFQTKSDANSVEQIVGILVELKFNMGRLDILIRPTDSIEYKKWSIESIQDAKMTVWRVNNVLDTLQFSVTGKREFYMQTGGSALSRIFRSNLTVSNFNEDIILAEKIFAENTLLVDH